MTIDKGSWEQWLTQGDHVLCSHLTAEPQTLLAALANADLPQSLMQSLTLELDTPFSMAADALPDCVPLQVLGGMGSASALGKKRTLKTDRTEYPALAEQFGMGERTADVVLISLAEDNDGSLHLGAAHGPAVQAARNARHVIVEVNHGAPVVAGSLWPKDIPIAHRVDCNYPIASFTAASDPSDVENRIAGQLAELIPDGACLQVGIGSLPAAVLSLLDSHKRLGIHSGMLGDSLYELIKRGAVDNSMKPVNLRHSVVGCVYGSQDLYQNVANNPSVVLKAPSVTHALDVLQTIKQFTAINSAIEVDLLGRVNAESIQTRDGSRRIVGGVGGLPAFVRGAMASPDGISIIALPSRTKPGPEGRARIVGSLESEITVDETLADIVVTEHGVARLRDASPEKRREQLIAIADPQDRDALVSAR